MTAEHALGEYRRNLLLVAVFATATVGALWAWPTRPFVAMFIVAVEILVIASSFTREQHRMSSVVTAAKTWVASTFILLLLVSVGGREVVQLQDAAPDSRPTVDFIAFYAAGVIASTEPENVYRADLQARIESDITGTSMTPSDAEFLPFAYPAVTTLLFVPLTVVEYQTAFYVAVAVNLAILGLAVGILASDGGFSEQASTVLAIGTAGLIAVPVTILEGQVSFIVLLLMATVIIDLRKMRPVRAGVWAGLLAFKPTVLPVLLVWLALRRQYRALLAALSVSLVLMLVSVLLVGWDGSAEFIDLSRAVAAEEFGSVNVAAMPNLRSVAQSAGLGSYGWLGLTVVVAGAFVVLGQRAAADAAGVLLVVSTTILVAPHIHVQELSLLIIPGAMLLHQQSQLSVRDRWTILGLMLGPSLTLAATDRFDLDALPLLALFVVVVWAISAWRVWVNREDPGQLALN